jgi:hypothetical protein
MRSFYISCLCAKWYIINTLEKIVSDCFLDLIDQSVYNVQVDNGYNVPMILTDTIIGRNGTDVSNVR